MGSLPSILGSNLLSNMAYENNGKPFKTKFEKIEKQNVDFCLFGAADHEYDRNKVVRLVYKNYIYVIFGLNVHIFMVSG